MHTGKQIVNHNSETIVATGFLATGSGEGLIRTTPLGSCVAVIAYDTTTKTGGIAHIMLPGRSPKKCKEGENKYAQNAISNLINDLILLETSTTNIEICLVGGANVLKKKYDNIGRDLIRSILENLKQQHLIVSASSLGGYKRRNTSLQLSSGIVTMAVGDESEQILYHFGVNSYPESLS
ncbi:MAG: chemotaxis protein CheD [Fidelibacterota bacterium]